MTLFAQLFQLADAARTSFELSPEHDATLLIDVDQITDWLVARIQKDIPAPQLVITGDFGTGKSHVLRYIEKKLAPGAKTRPFYFQLGAFMRRAGFNDLHITVMDEMIEALEENLGRVKNLKQVLHDRTALKGDILSCLLQLADASTPQAKRVTLRSWLRGIGPSPTQARKELGFSGKLFDGANSITLINLWKAAGEIQRAADGRTLLLLMDEGEAFSKMVSPDAQVAMGSGLRTLFDADNRSVGIALGLNTPTSRKGIHPMLQPDVTTRLEGKQLSLTPLGDPARIRMFIEGLWQRLRSAKAPPLLFDEQALEFISRNLRELRNAISLRSQTLSPTPTQRDLMNVLRYIGEFAVRDVASPPLTKQMLIRWFPSRTEQ